MNAYGSSPGHCMPSMAWERVSVEKRILVVDDDQHSREGLRVSLQDEGYRVEAAADSWQAIKLIKEHPFDIAIIDLDLPPVHGVSVNGWDLARIFRAYHPAISIIVVSAVDRNTARAEAERLSVSEVLEKPINPTQLKGIVRSLDSLSEGRPTGGSN